MTDKPTDAQRKEFLQWCGIQCYYKDRTNNDIEAWICPPDSEKTIAFYGLTLDFLFKYAVPKFKEMCTSRPDYDGVKTCDNDIHIFLRLCEGQGCFKKGWLCSIQGFRELAYVEGIDKDPALALFWALWQVKEKQT